MSLDRHEPSNRPVFTRRWWKITLWSLTGMSLFLILAILSASAGQMNL